MPFEVTATRKRPQNFEQLAGQEFVAATLTSSLRQGRIAHAYLFSGPRGCGKTSTARILAKALNCEHGPTPNPCGTCASCVAIASGTSLDVIEIDGASNTSVDNVRQIKDEVLFAPNTGRYKIYIIDEVHMLSMSAFNALLKTIEEPPPYVVFMFATTEPQKVPATIKSRCQQFNFRLVPVETIVNLLRQAANDLGIQAEEEALLWIAREASGSIRDAYTLFDQIASFSGTAISAQGILSTLGLVGQERLNTLFKSIATGSTGDALLVLSSILESGVSPEQFLSDCVAYCRSLLLLGHGITRESLLSAPAQAFAPEVLQAFSAMQIEYALGILLDTYRHLKETIDPRYELELAIARLSRLKSYLPPSELFTAIATLKQALSSLAGTEKGTALPFQGKGMPIPDEYAESRRSIKGNSAPSVVQRGAALRDSVYHPTGTAMPGGTAPSGQTSSLSRSAAPHAAAIASANSNITEQSPSDCSQQTQDTAAIRPEDIRKALIARFRKENPFLASALEKSGEWIRKHDGFIITVSTKVEYDLVNRFSSTIAALAASMLKQPCAIELRHGSQSRGGLQLRPSGDPQLSSHQAEAPLGTAVSSTSAKQDQKPIEGQSSILASTSDKTSSVPRQTYRNSAPEEQALSRSLTADAAVSDTGSPESDEVPDSFHSEVLLSADMEDAQAEEVDSRSGSYAEDAVTRATSNTDLSTLPEEDASIIEALRSMFKGTVVALHKRSPGDATPAASRSVDPTLPRTSAVSDIDEELSAFDETAEFED
ncbi:MAG: DNA polymerase III subunit gamma/tau [Spirochaetaceae bacterium]|nr:DNA polymerase III subunit gamma/tau [Spirochaetaceae bacterium]